MGLLCALDALARNIAINANDQLRLAEMRDVGWACGSVEDTINPLNCIPLILPEGRFKSR
jgi:hypothetical protein